MDSESRVRSASRACAHIFLAFLPPAEISDYLQHGRLRSPHGSAEAAQPRVEASKRRMEAVLPNAVEAACQRIEEAWLSAEAA